MTLTFRTLCSGGELFGLGAVAAGFRHQAGYERDPRIAAVAERNGFDVYCADICDIDYTVLEAVDHLHASPSCTTASSANERQGEIDADLRVAAAICRAIRAHQGRSFSLENVWFYRTYTSFKMILATLDACGFVTSYAHINMADFGVPQTRKRLILRAVRRSWRACVPPLQPTHSKDAAGGTARWCGWCAAIIDLVNTLPPTQPAPWQVARMPQQLLHAALFHSGRSMDRHGNVYGQHHRTPEEPAYTVNTMSGGWYKAYLVSAGSNGQHPTVPLREAHAPALTITTNNKGRLRAFIISGQNARTSGNAQCLTVRADDQPLWTLTAGGSCGEYKAALSGRWVGMTPQALGRFQTVPDSYLGLTPEINGNGVPPLFAQRLMETLR